MVAGVRLFLDTNVLVSAVLFGGTPGLLVEAVRSGRVTGIVSLHVLSEFVDVMTRPRFGFDKHIALALAEEIADFCEVVPLEHASSMWVADSGDDPVVEAALLGRATHLVTGDAVLCALTLDGLCVIRPADALVVVGPAESP